MRSIWISEVKYVKYLFLTFYVVILNTNAKADKNTQQIHLKYSLYFLHS